MSTAGKVLVVLRGLLLIVAVGAYTLYLCDGIDLHTSADIVALSLIACSAIALVSR